MGLSRIEIGFLSRALKAGVLPSGGDLLEVGESQVVPADAAGDLLSILAPLLPAPRVEEAERRISAASRSKSQYQNAFGSARALYHAIFDPNSYAAIDLEPGPRRFCFDLNEPVTIDREFDCVINNGTSEHIFNQANVFESIHDCTRPGGLMIHWTPCFGWLNHGFYNVQPTLFFDLVAANDYDAQLVCVAGTDACVPIASAEEAVQAVRRHPSLTESLVCAVLRKQRQASFQVPLQGGYHQPAGVLRLARSPQSRLRPLGPNLALGRPAKQSSTSAWSWHDDPPMDASGGNDGRITGYFGFHTELEQDPWWMVDLGAQLPLREIVVYNRLDDEVVAARAAHLRLSLSDDGSSWHEVYARREDAPFGGADGAPLRVPLYGRRARYVRVSVPGHTILHLDEVEIY